MGGKISKKKIILKGYIRVSAINIIRLKQSGFKQSGVQTSFYIRINVFFYFFVRNLYNVIIIIIILRFSIIVIINYVCSKLLNKVSFYSLLVWKKTVTI